MESVNARYPQSLNCCTYIITFTTITGLGIIDRRNMAFLDSKPYYFLDELAKRINAVVFAYDSTSNQFTYANPSFEHLWELTIEKVNANPQVLLERIHHEDREYVLETYEALVKEAIPDKAIEFRILMPGLTLKWVSVEFYYISDTTGKQMLGGIANDITAVKNHQENLHKFAAKKNSVLEILSHDLAGPFRNIKGISNLMSKKIQKYEDPDIEKMVEMISNTSERSIRLIRDFVKQEFLESVHEALIKKRVDIVHELRNVVEQYKNSEKDIKKTFKLKAPSENIYMDIDQYKFIQAINNLISNSIKFTHDNGIIIIGIEEQEKTILFTVEDNGIGIPANRQEGLFEKFTKARRPGIKGEPSVGLGMSIIKTIVEWHNGKIWFESEENKGSKFFIEMPKE